VAVRRMYRVSVALSFEVEAEDGFDAVAMVHKSLEKDKFQNLKGVRLLDLPTLISRKETEQ
jgi:hypothetical protein